MSKVNCEAVGKRRQASLRMAQAELLHTIAKEINKHRSFQKHNKFNEPIFRCTLAINKHLLL